jgi:low temperature requirement protein LtrA
VAVRHRLPGSAGRALRVPHRGPSWSTAGRALRQRPRRETVLTTGSAFVGEPFDLERLLALAIGFAGTVALWWCYFQRAEALGAQAAETAEDAGSVALWGTWTLTLIVLGLIGIAVADEMAIAHPGDEATLGFTVLAFGGPALFLLSQLLFQYAVLRLVPRSRVLGIVALAILAVATGQLTLIVGIAASSAVLIAVAITDTVHGSVRAASTSA